MRPLGGSEACQARSRKPSLGGPSVPPDEPRSTSPITFFLRRGSQGHEPIPSPEGMRGQGSSPVQSLDDTLETLPPSTSTIVPQNDVDEPLQSEHRRSTLRALLGTASQRSPGAKSQSQSSSQEPLTPLLIPSAASSLPSSPKSLSTRSWRPSEAGSTAEDPGSLALLPSGDEESHPQPASPSGDPAPQLIMPSIKIPSRRPFTARGKQIGNFKILIAGAKGVGKSSLIKAMVQTCEDIVHVDPLLADKPPTIPSSSKGKQVMQRPELPPTSEINASTRPLPSWWSEIEDSKTLRRRRSLGDTILDRNLCFVDTESKEECHALCEYIGLQLQRAVRASTTASHEFATLLSGSGGSQVDVIFYMLSKDSLEVDVSKMKTLSEMSNVIPLISKADLLSPEQIDALKGETRSLFDAIILPKLPPTGAHGEEQETQGTPAPYTVSSATAPDHEIMDASLLMSPDYVQPLMPSELSLLVHHIFETDVMAYLRQSAAKKLIAWGANHARSPKPASLPQSSFFPPQPPNPTSPLACPPSDSGALIPVAPDTSLNTNTNGQEAAAAAAATTTTTTTTAMARLAEHTQQEERLAQARLTRWANDLQHSLQRERDRFEKLARGDRAIWLIERMGEEATAAETMARGGKRPSLLHQTDHFQARDKTKTSWPLPLAQHHQTTHDPLGMVRWSSSGGGWMAFQLLGGFGVVGGLAFWIARTWGSTWTIGEWTQGWSWSWPFVG